MDKRCKRPTYEKLMEKYKTFKNLSYLSIKTVIRTK